MQTAESVSHAYEPAGTRAVLPDPSRYSARPDGEIAILWIDDRPDTALLSFLSLDGFSITSVATGRAGLDLALVETYDLIVLDLHLPDLHGLTVLQRLRTLRVSTPVLVVTGHYVDVETASYAQAADATAFRFKPLWADEAGQLLRSIARGFGAPCTVAEVRRDAPRSDEPLDESSAGEILTARLLAALDVLAVAPDGACNGERSHDALLAPLLTALADPVLPLAAFRVCADVVRTAVHGGPEAEIGPLAVRGRDVLREAARRPVRARRSTAGKVLSLLMSKPRWWREDDVAAEVAMSPSRVGRLLCGDTGIEYRTLRRLIVMKSAVVDVLTTDDQFAQIAHRLGMHPGSFDAVFDKTFGICPRRLRRLWNRLPH